MEFRELNYLITIAEERSISKAAEKLFMGPLQHDLPGLSGADAGGGADEQLSAKLRLHTLEGLAQDGLGHK